MLWKTIILRNLVNRYNSIKRSRIRRSSSTNDKNNSTLNAPVIGDLGLLRKRKVDVPVKDRVRKKRKMMNDNNSGVTDFDRISDLPEPIIHQIFGHLKCTKDVVRISVVSKKFKSMFDSYMVFDFDERWFNVRGAKGKHNRIKARELKKKKFKRYVDRSLASRLDSVPRIEKFRLSMEYNFVRASETCIMRWILAAVEKNVKELNIDVDAGDKSLVLSPLLFSYPSVTSLKVRGFLVFGLTPMKLSNLRVLSIKDTILVFDDLVKTFPQSFPLLEDLRLVNLGGLTRLNISALHMLKRVEVHGCHRMNCIEIEAPMLDTFLYHEAKSQECKIDLKGSRNLKVLTLKHSRMTDTAFQDCLSKCPFIEKLVLRECIRLEKLTILSEKLKSLDLIDCVKLQEVNIDAPNLVSFQYSGQTLPFSSFNVLHLYEAKFNFGLSMRTTQFIADYLKCFGHLDQSKGFKLILHSKEKMVIYDEPRDLDRNHFSKLELTASSEGVLRIVDNWLREYHGSCLELVVSHLQ